jgi:hypothetical protein
VTAQVSQKLSRQLFGAHLYKQGNPLILEVSNPFDFAATKPEPIRYTGRGRGQRVSEAEQRLALPPFCILSRKQDSFFRVH